MKKTETQQVLDALKLLDPELSFSDWENGDGEDIGHQLCAAAALLQADLARVVKPVGRVAGDDVRRLIVWSPAVAAFDYPVGTLVYATPQEAVAPELDLLRKELDDANAESASRLRVVRSMDRVINNHCLAMSAALIELYVGEGTVPAMAWIENTLAGPGLLPNYEEAQKLGGAQAWFDQKSKEYEDAFAATEPTP